MSAYILSTDDFSTLHASLFIETDRTAIACIIARDYYGELDTEQHADGIIRKLARCNAIAVCGRYPRDDVKKALDNADNMTLDNPKRQKQFANIVSPLGKKELLCSIYKKIECLEYQCSETPRKGYEVEYTDSMALLTEFKATVANMIIRSLPEYMKAEW